LKGPRSLLQKKAFDTDLSYGSNDEREDDHEDDSPRIVEYTPSASDSEVDKRKIRKKMAKEAR
jgi:hypothetical protein